MTIQVTLAFEDQDALVAFFTRGATPAAVQVEAPKVVEKAAKETSPKKSAPAVEAAPSQANTGPADTTAPGPTASLSEPAPTYTLEAVRAKLAALSQGGKQVQVKELIASMGATKLTDLKAEQYAELMTKAGAL